MRKNISGREISSKSLCVPAKICDQGFAYDYETNECRDVFDILSDADLKEIKNGKFCNWEDIKENQEERKVDYKSSKVKLNLKVSNFYNQESEAC